MVRLFAQVRECICACIFMCTRTCVRAYVYAHAYQHHLKRCVCLTQYISFDSICPSAPPLHLPSPRSSPCYPFFLPLQSALKQHPKALSKTRDAVVLPKSDGETLRSVSAVSAYRSVLASRRGVGLVPPGTADPPRASDVFLH